MYRPYLYAGENHPINVTHHRGLQSYGNHGGLYQFDLEGANQVKTGAKGGTKVASKCTAVTFNPKLTTFTLLEICH